MLKSIILEPYYYSKDIFNVYKKHWKFVVVNTAISTIVTIGALYAIDKYEPKEKEES